MVSLNVAQFFTTDGGGNFNTVSNKVLKTCFISTGYYEAKVANVWPQPGFRNGSFS